jgi:hypothetical protein
MGRAYYVFQFNIRRPDGTPMPGADAERIVKEDEQLGWKGEDWWLDNGEHKPGDDPCFELDCDVEGELDVEGQKEPEAILMDQLYCSYDPTQPSRPVEDGRFREAAATMLLEKYGRDLRPCVTCGMPYDRGCICTHCGDVSPHVPKEDK